MYRKNKQKICRSRRTRDTLKLYSKEAKECWENEEPRVRQFFKILAELARIVWCTQSKATAIVRKNWMNIFQISFCKMIVYMVLFYVTESWHKIYKFLYQLFY